jgi:hypothetical protein
MHPSKSLSLELNCILRPGAATINRVALSLTVQPADDRFAVECRLLPCLPPHGTLQFTLNEWPIEKHRSVPDFSSRTPVARAATSQAGANVIQLAFNRSKFSLTSRSEGSKFTAREATKLRNGRLEA